MYVSVCVCVCVCVCMNNLWFFQKSFSEMLVPFFSEVLVTIFISCSLINCAWTIGSFSWELHWKSNVTEFAIILKTFCQRIPYFLVRVVMNWQWIVYSYNKSAQFVSSCYNPYIQDLKKSSFWSLWLQKQPTKNK